MVANYSVIFVVLHAKAFLSDPSFQGMGQVCRNGRGAHVTQSCQYKAIRCNVALEMNKEYFSCLHDGEKSYKFTVATCISVLQTTEVFLYIRPERKVGHVWVWFGLSLTQMNILE